MCNHLCNRHSWEALAGEVVQINMKMCNQLSEKVSMGKSLQAAGHKYLGYVPRLRLTTTGNPRRQALASGKCWPTKAILCKTNKNPSAAKLCLGKNVDVSLGDQCVTVSLSIVYLIPASSIGAGGCSDLFWCHVSGVDCWFMFLKVFFNLRKKN